MSFTLDDQNNGTPNGTFNMGDVTTDVEIANQFVPSATDNISRVTLKLSKSGSPVDNLFVKIYTDSAGTPNTLLGTSGTILGSTLTGSATDYNFDFTTAISLTSGTTYWLSLARSGGADGSNYYVMSARTPNYRADSKKFTPWVVELSTYSIYFIEYRGFVSTGGLFLSQEI